MGIQQLDNNICIKVKIVGVYFERDGPQGIHPVGTVAGMEFRQVSSENLVLQGSEDLVSDPLIKRHSTLQRRPLIQHTRPKNSFRLIIQQRLY